MENLKRLQSYYFECPCCKSTQKRLFEYYAKFHGFIDEKENLKNFNEPSMLERVEIDGSDEKRTIKIQGQPIYRCGVCYEFFKFKNNYSQPETLTEPEKLDALSKFKPVSVTPDIAVMNSVAFFDKLLNENGCALNANGEIEIRGKNGEVYSFDIAEALVAAFYNNPNMQINEAYQETHRAKVIESPVPMLKDA